VKEKKWKAEDGGHERQRQKEASGVMATMPVTERYDDDWRCGGIPVRRNNSDNLGSQGHGNHSKSVSDGNDEHQHHHPCVGCVHGHCDCVQKGRQDRCSVSCLTDDNGFDDDEDDDVSWQGGLIEMLMHCIRSWWSSSICSGKRRRRRGRRGKRRSCPIELYQRSMQLCHKLVEVEKTITDFRAAQSGRGDVVGESVISSSVIDIGGNGGGVVGDVAKQHIAAEKSAKEAMNALLREKNLLTDMIRRVEEERRDKRIEGYYA